MWVKVYNSFAKVCPWTLSTLRDPSLHRQFRHRRRRGFSALPPSPSRPSRLRHHRRHLEPRVCPLRRVQHPSQDVRRALRRPQKHQPRLLDPSRPLLRPRASHRARSSRPHRAHRAHRARPARPAPSSRTHRSPHPRARRRRARAHRAHLDARRGRPPSTVCRLAASETFVDDGCLRSIVAPTRVKI